MHSAPLISFVVPAFNEAQRLPSVLRSIRSSVPANLSYEVIVVDHGSTDETVPIAQREGVKVYNHPHGTVAALRNFGRRQAAGRILIFLDADMLLTAQWRDHIAQTVVTLRQDPRIVTGSWCGVRADPSWIERYWFMPLVRGGNTHINSGHLIVTTTAFDELGCFSDELETGEDYDFSMRAKAVGMKIVDNPDLFVIHEGYPRTVKEFLRRERWHGKGDYASVRITMTSKVALVSLLFWALHLGLVLSLVVAGWKSAGAFAALIASLCIAAAFAKYRSEKLSTMTLNGVLYYVYFFARGLSLIDAARRPDGYRHQRDSASSGLRSTRTPKR